MLSVNFFALDFRRYGRAKLKDQRSNYCNSLTEYFEEIHAALVVMSELGIKDVCIMGAGTGTRFHLFGLLVSSQIDVVYLFSLLSSRFYLTH
jgi:hypothetical protein